jgi:hypothetical protein
MEALYEKTEALIRPEKIDVVRDTLILVMGTYSFFMERIFSVFVQRSQMKPHLNFKIIRKRHTP